MASKVDEQDLMRSGEIFAPQEGPQTIAFTCPYEDICYGGARGGGKTFLLLLDAHAHSERYGEDAKMLLVRRTLNELKDFIFEAKKWLRKMGWIYKVGEKTFYSPTGAFLRLNYLENDEDADQYQGHQYTRVYVEEMGSFPNPDPIKKLKATLRSASGVKKKFIGTCNPGGKGHKWIKESYISPVDPMTPFPDPDTGIYKIFIPSKLTDNKILMEADPQYKNLLKGSGPSWLVDAWLNGNWDISPEGNVFSRDWFRFYKQNALPNFDFIAQSWDTAYKDKKKNDRSACTTWGITKTDFYLLDCWAQRVQYPVLKQTAASLADKWNPRAIFIEDKSSGQSLIQEMRRDTRLPVIAISVDANKYARACAVSPLFESGKVWLPESAPWLHDFTEELASFPLSAHDDIVDSLSQALDRLAHYQNQFLHKDKKVVPFRGSLYQQ